MSSPRQGYGSRFVASTSKGHSPRSSDRSRMSSITSKGLSHRPTLRAGKKAASILARQNKPFRAKLDVTIEPSTKRMGQPPIRAHGKNSPGVALPTRPSGPFDHSRVAVAYSRVDRGQAARDMKRFTLKPRLKESPKPVAEAVSRLKSPRSCILEAIDLTSRKDDIFLIDEDDSKHGESAEGKKGTDASSRNRSLQNIALSNVNIKTFNRRKSSNPERLGTLMSAEARATAVNCVIRISDQMLLTFGSSKIIFYHGLKQTIDYQSILDAHYLQPAHSTGISLLAIKTEALELRHYDCNSIKESDQYVCIFVKGNVKTMLETLQLVMTGVLSIHDSEDDAPAFLRILMSHYRMALAVPARKKRFSSSRQISLKELVPEVMLEPKEVVTWPAPPAKDGITLRTGDVTRLKSGEFLNDQLIDFYLKYLGKTSAKEDVHIFNSHFYKRGSQKPQDVLRWTKGIDIFSKEYLIIPVHDHSHWLLAIVCHPGSKPERQRAINLGDTDGSEEKEIKTLFFDSLSTSCLTAARRIRRFLQVIWDHDHPEQERDFSFVNHTQLDVPQQDNFSDCGVFVLHYTEMFLKDPRDEPLQFDPSWFPLRVIRNKRFAFKQLIKKLMLEQSEEPDKELVSFLDGNFSASERPVLRLREKVVADERDGVVYLDSDDESVSEVSENKKESGDEELKTDTVTGGLQPSDDDDEVFSDNLTSVLDGTPIFGEERDTSAKGIEATDEIDGDDDLKWDDLESVQGDVVEDDDDVVEVLGKRKRDESEAKMAKTAKKRRIIRNFSPSTVRDDAERSKQFEEELFGSQ